MVRFKVRWILFELIQDPIIDNNKKVTFPRTPAKLCDDDLNKCIHSAMTIDYGDFGQGMARSVYGKRKTRTVTYIYMNILSEKKKREEREI